MASTVVSQKRPRIDNDVIDEITTMHPDVPFERAVNQTIREAYDARVMLSEAILALSDDEGRNIDEWREKVRDLADSMNTVSLIRVLKLRLHDRGVDL